MAQTEIVPELSDRRYAISEACLRAIRPPMQFQSGDLEDLFAGTAECLQLTDGVLECRGSRVSLPGVRITELHINCGVQIHSPVEPWRLLILLFQPAPGSRILSNGTDCGREWCVAASGEELEVNILGPTSLLWFDVDRRAFARNDRDGLFESIHCVLPLRVAERAALASYARDRFAADRAGGYGVLDESDGCADLRIRNCASTIVHRARSCVRSGTDASRERVVRAAQELMWASIEEPPMLRDICSAAKCSVRTLIYAFNATFGMSPMKYFKIQRLNAAHRKLKAGGSVARIFDVAADCGFWHLGHFGVDYKRFFGTTPAMTSRVAPAARPLQCWDAGGP